MDNDWNLPGSCICQHMQPGKAHENPDRSDAQRCIFLFFRVGDSYRSHNFSTRKKICVERGVAEHAASGERLTRSLPCMFRLSRCFLAVARGCQRRLHEAHGPSSAPCWPHLCCARGHVGARVGRNRGRDSLLQGWKGKLDARCASNFGIV